MIVVVGGEKGGTGKTTVAVNLTAMRQIDKGDTIIVDAEPTQKSTTLWSLSRDESQIEPRITSVNKTGKTLRRDLLTLGEKFSTVVVDVGGTDSVELRGAILAADVVISPLQPSQFDIWTLDRMNRMIGEAKDINPKIRSYLLLTIVHTNPRVKDLKEAYEYYGENTYEHIKMLPFVLHNRNIYRKVVGGYSVHENATDKKAEEELNQLYQEVFQNV